MEIVCLNRLLTDERSPDNLLSSYEKRIMESAALEEILMEYIDEHFNSVLIMKGKKIHKWQLILNQTNPNDLDMAYLKSKLLPDLASQFRARDLLLMADLKKVSLKA